LAGIALAWLVRRFGRTGAAAAGLALGVAIAGPSVAWHVHRLHAGEIPRLAQQHAHRAVVVELVRDPTVVGGSSLVLVDATALRVSDRGWEDVDVPVLLLAHGTGWLRLLPGQRVRIDAGFAPPRSGDDVAAVLMVSSPPVLIGHPGWWQRAAGRARVALERSCASLPADPRGLLPSLVDGDTAAVPADLRADMQVSGLSHLEAVSGENLSIVLGVVLSAARTAGLRRRSRVMGAALAVIGFVILARPSPSVLRAAVMSGVALLAMFAGRRTSGRSTLAVAVLILVVANPFLARSVGFALSVMATAGIIVLAPRWTQRLAARLPRPLALAVAVSAAAQLACTPVLLLAFGQLTPYAVPANVLAAPAVVPATILGVLAAVVAPLSAAVAAPLVWLAGVPTALVARVARIAAALPGAGAVVPRGVSVVVAIGIATLLVRLATSPTESSQHAIL
jgi:competence protein ComEC